ncbi:hypothetical protein T06_4767, partial [Trichinella sp. T6]
MNPLSQLSSTVKQVNEDSTNGYTSITTNIHQSPEKLEEDFKIRFEDLESMTVPDWIIAPFDIETGNANIEFSLQKEHVEMSADLEAKLLFKHKSLSEFWSN